MRGKWSAVIVVFGIGLELAYSIISLASKQLIIAAIIELNPVRLGFGACLDFGLEQEIIIAATVGLVVVVMHIADTKLN